MTDTIATKLHARWRTTIGEAGECGGLVIHLIVHFFCTQYKSITYCFYINRGLFILIICLLLLSGHLGNDCAFAVPGVSIFFVASEWIRGSGYCTCWMRASVTFAVFVAALGWLLVEDVLASILNAASVCDASICFYGKGEGNHSGSMPLEQVAWNRFGLKGASTPPDSGALGDLNAGSRNSFIRTLHKKSHQIL